MGARSERGLQVGDQVYFPDDPGLSNHPHEVTEVEDGSPDITVVDCWDDSEHATTDSGAERA